MAHANRLIATIDKLSIGKAETPIPARLAAEGQKLQAAEVVVVQTERAAVAAAAGC